MKSAGEKTKRRSVAMAALLCALVAALAIAVAPAAAESGETAEVRDLDDGGMVLPAITGPGAPQEYPCRVDLGEEQKLTQVSETEALVEYPGGETAFSIRAAEAHDAEGATVPTSLWVSGRDVVTWVVHYRGGNPAAGGAPFLYPITAGSGWPGGFRTIVVPMTNPLGEPQQPTTTTYCRVPPLRDLSLRAAKTRLRTAHCAIGEVHLAAGATAGKGKVVKQFRAAGTELAAGAPVAVKLGSR
ncbi:MAG TPA: PASTA domain-containing protein [Solirubrobacterales bacterium]|jgi:hypothetical protein|nr:PASTA domain-containing protein [Solirubrobacterales bacterium]